MDFVKDFRWEKGMNVDDFVSKLSKVGYQSVELSKAADVIVKMKKDNSKIFLTFTSNMVTSGLRDVFRYLVEHKLVDVIVTTAGGVEEDLIKTI